MKILKFSADWCRPCKQLSAIMDKMEIPYTLEQIDIDEKDDIAISYGIRSVPTLVLVEDDGKELKRLVGLANETKIKEWLQ